MNQYNVMISGVEPRTMDADFMHVKEGMICLYRRGERDSNFSAYGSDSKPEMIAAFSTTTVVYKVT
jgi:hypothetical protein